MATAQVETPNDRSQRGLYRFAEYMAARRGELDGTEPQPLLGQDLDGWLWAVTLRFAGPLDVRNSYCAGVEKNMGWAPGSVERILAGGEPEPLCA